MWVEKPSASYRAVHTVIIAVLVAMSLLAILPLLHMLAVSFSEEKSANAGLVGLWPMGFQVTAYKMAMKEDLFVSTFWVSVQRVLLGTAINVILNIMVSYPLSLSSAQFPLRKLYATFFLITMLFDAGVVPGYLLIKNLNLMNSIWALVLTWSVQVYSVILMMNFFRQLPSSISEAAMVDGAGHLMILARIYIPLSLPVLATVTLFAAIRHWNSWFDGLLFMSNQRNYPLQTYLQSLMAQVNNAVSLDDARRMSEVSRRSLMYARIIISVIPITLIYPYLMRYFKTGIVLGSVKG